MRLWFVLYPLVNSAPPAESASMPHAYSFIMETCCKICLMILFVCDICSTFFIVSVEKCLIHIYTYFM